MKRLTTTLWRFGAPLVVAAAFGGGAAAMIVTSVPVSAQPKAPKKGKYVGSKACKKCHNKTKSGDQHGAWTRAGHSQAFTTLASDEAKSIAKTRGIADAQKSPQCLPCHVTEHSIPAKRLSKKFDRLAGVGCESCHGPGKKHVTARLMAAADGAGDDGKPAVVPDKEIIAHPKQALCKSCHNEKSPTYLKFDCEQRVGKIMHRDPRKDEGISIIRDRVCQ